MDNQALTQRPWDPQVHLQAAQRYLALAKAAAARQENARAEALGRPSGGPRASPPDASVSTKTHEGPDATGPLVAWRSAAARAAGVYAAIVRELAVSATRAGRQGKLRPPSAVLGFMVSLGGQWSRASPQHRETLLGAYERLGLKYAATALRRMEPGPGSGAVPDASPTGAAAAYFAPAEHVYDLEETFDRGVELLEAGDWPQALASFSEACRGYRHSGGLYELRAADCLLNMSVAGIHLDRLEAALAWASAAQLSYERWGRLGQAAKAALNRIGILHRLGRSPAAARLAADCDAIALPCGIATLAADARCVRLALDAQIRPRAALVKSLQRLRRHYGERCDPPRRAAYGRCRRLAQSALDHAVARQTLGMILKRAVERGVPEGFEPLKSLFCRRPEAVAALTESSFLELPARAWPVLADAAAYVSMWVEGGSLTFPSPEQAEDASRRIDQLERALRFWQDPRLPGAGDYRRCRPTQLLQPQPRRLSLDAAMRLAELAEPWARHWLDPPEERIAIGTLCLLGVAPLVAAKRDEAAQTLRHAEVQARACGGRLDE